MALRKVMTFTEAAERWKLCDGSLLRKKQVKGLFQDEEISLSGGTWLVTEEAMTRLFGLETNQEWRLEKRRKKGETRGT